MSIPYRDATLSANGIQEDEDEECRHDVIETWRWDEDGGRLWACGICFRRFYPACSTCVTVGHRGEVHSQEEAPRVDVKRLQRALDSLPSSIGSMMAQYPTDVPGVWRHEPIAEAIVRAYVLAGK